MYFMNILEIREFCIVWHIWKHWLLVANFWSLVEIRKNKIHFSVPIDSLAQEMKKCRYFGGIQVSDKRTQIEFCENNWDLHRNLRWHRFAAETTLGFDIFHISFLLSRVNLEDLAMPVGRQFYSSWILSPTSRHQLFLEIQGIMRNQALRILSRRPFFNSDFTWFHIHWFEFCFFTFFFLFENQNNNKAGQPQSYQIFHKYSLWPVFAESIIIDRNPRF